MRADYERLREGALQGGGQGWRFGRSVLARSGLADWISGWREHLAATEEATVTEHGRAQVPYPPLGTPATSPHGGALSGSEPVVTLLALMLSDLLNPPVSTGVGA